MPRRCDAQVSPISISISNPTSWVSYLISHNPWWRRVHSFCKLTQIAPTGTLLTPPTKWWCGISTSFRPYMWGYRYLQEWSTFIPHKTWRHEDGIGTCGCTEAVPYSTASVHPHMSRKERTHKSDKIIRITRQNSTIRDIRYLVVKNKSIIIAPSIHTHIHIVLYSVFGKLLSYNKELIYSSTQLCHFRTHT